MTEKVGMDNVNENAKGQSSENKPFLVSFKKWSIAHFCSHIS